MLGGGTALSYYVEALWFDSLGYSAVFWKTLNVQAATFVAFALVTFAVLYGAFLALKPARLGEIAGGTILINGQPLKLPVEPVLKLIALAVSVAIAFITGLGMMAQWPTLALYWYAPDGAALARDPIFNRPLTFYLFTLPAWEIITGWLMTLAVVVCAMAILFVVVTGGTRVLERVLTRGRNNDTLAGPWRGLSIAFAAFLLMLAARVYLGRYERLLEDHTIFAGVTYTEAHVTLTGMLVVAVALVAGALMAAINAVSAPRMRWLIASVVPALVCYVVVSVVGWYVSGFIVKPNELVREQPYITNNITMTRQAYGLDRMEQRPFPADSGIEALDGREQSGDAAERPAVGLARAPGHAAPDPGDPHLLRFSRYRHRPL